jgi:hypothetical protein
MCCYPNRGSGKMRNAECGKSATGKVRSMIPQLYSAFYPLSIFRILPFRILPAAFFVAMVDRVLEARLKISWPWPGGSGLGLVCHFWPCYMRAMTDNNIVIFTQCSSDF